MGAAAHTHADAGSKQLVHMQAFSAQTPPGLNRDTLARQNLSANIRDNIVCVVHRFMW